MIRRLKAILFPVCCIFFLHCSDKNNGNQSIDRKELKEPLIEANIEIAREESRMIDKYIERHEWDMEVTGTGLRYMIYQKGPGIIAKAGMRATVEYEIKLLDGTICYSSIEKGPRNFMIGKDHVESGIHEGVTLMHVGDKAKFVIPSFLAHGLSGDNDKIPPRSVLIVDLKLLRLD